jgi:hypothetical protein
MKRSKTPSSHELPPLPQGALMRRMSPARQAPSALACAVGSFGWVVSAAGLDAWLGTPLAFVIVVFQSIMFVNVVFMHIRNKPTGQ